MSADPQMPPGGWDRPIATRQPLSAAPAGWWRRAGASLIDLLVLTAPAVGLAVVLFGDDTASFDRADAGSIATLVLGLLALLLGFFLAAFLYAPLLMMRGGARNGQTLGKQLLGIRVVRGNGLPMDFLWSALREALVKGVALGLASLVVAFLPYLLDVLWPLWDDENRALHDLMVDTRVVEAEA